MDTPIYDAVLTEQGFDPASVPANSVRANREFIHKNWLDSTWRTILRQTKDGYRTPRARKTAKAVPAQRGSIEP